MNELKVIEIIISFALMLVGFGIIWGKHTASVKSQGEKNDAQDAAIIALHEKIQAREDKIRTDVNDRLKVMEGKLDSILMKLSK